jgi:hypothetical protein
MVMPQMSVDSTALGELVAEQMAAIEKDMDEGTVRVVCSVVGIEGPDGEQSVRFRSNCPPSVQLQLLAAAQQGIAAQLAQQGQPPQS